VHIYIGTSGYSFQDWKGNFYPEKINNSNMLSYYAQYFNITEINASFYRIMPAKIYSSMLKKVPENFTFCAKLHQSFTHTKEISRKKIEIYEDSLIPLAESGRLLSVLAQFPWAFKYNEQNINRLLNIADSIKIAPLAVEFRNDSWNNEDVLNIMKQKNLTFCVVDEPVINHLMSSVWTATSNIGYVRFHGRNADDWFGKDENKDRYNYLYSKQELLDIIPNIEKLSNMTEKTLIFFNNCHLGSAVKNAQMLQEMFGQTISLDKNNLF